MTNVYRDAQTNRCFISHTVKQTDRQTDILLHIRWNRQTDKQMFYYTYGETSEIIISTVCVHLPKWSLNYFS